MENDRQDRTQDMRGGEEGDIRKISKLGKERDFRKGGRKGKVAFL